MNPAVKLNAINEAEAIAKVGAANIEAVKNLNCEFTNRLIDEVYEQTEMSASINCEDVDGNEVILTINYLLDNSDIEDAGGDMGNCDYSNYTFEII
jgi:hypothetical protein